MSSIGQYLRETQAELRHVAWPTRTQTIVYTILVALISLFVAAYLGFFDFLFTTGIARIVDTVSNRAAPSSVTQTPISTSSVPTLSTTTIK